jgi:hypothetical protein
VAIAAAITYYGRIFMQQKYFNLENNPPFYSDTDSIYVEKKIETALLSNKLGF